MFTIRNSVLAASSLFLLICLLGAGWTVWGFSLFRPQVACDEEVLDFGQKRTGEKFEHVFILHNEGNKELQITKIQSACSCAVPEMKDKVIPRKGSLAVPVTVSLANYRGRFENQLVVVSNDPERPNLVLKLQGVVKADIEFKPRILELGTVVAGYRLPPTLALPHTGGGEERRNLSHKGGGKEPEKVIELWAADEGVSFEVQKVWVEPPDLSARVEVVKKGKTYRVRVAADGTSPGGRVQARVHIRTNHPREQEIVVPVTAQVVKWPGFLPVAMR